ncbi:hypothetical protein OW763_11890 [Clostridium aestuarii]|uniref:SIR2-like domain-containing protein n=1 Tax=Clostridium aestuarii TaxID=338193 RepID=A0ABT4D1C3_9CLOT|nr:hypothetical protein [Clostridium aestuarii]MCY6485041.1 hypothetical protein [Clostridium aestuarii]
MKLGILFGAGAEIDYGLPSGGEFALDIFRQDTNKSKEKFKQIRDSIDYSTHYATYWLPNDYATKSVSSYGKSAFETIIRDTIEHNRGKIIAKFNDFDNIAKKEEKKLVKKYNKSVTKIIEEKLGQDIAKLKMAQVISFVDIFKEGNKIFNSNYFPAMLLLYKDKNLLSENVRNELRKIIISIFQLQIGSLSQNLTRRINDGIFATKDDSIDLLDDIGDIIQLNYQSTGLSGLEYVIENKKIDLNSDDNVILYFCKKIIETIYSSALDYKSLIDSNWHYLYCPKDEWAKFCKINIFLITVRQYMLNHSYMIKKKIKNGYYHDLKQAIDKKNVVSSIATTNYNTFISDVLGEKIYFLNGSTEIWYDPYLNRIGKKSDLENDEKHFLVPLLFTQSGTKPMTSIEMSMQYVNMYKNFKKSDAICVVGFGFNLDDEHINGILRTLIDGNNKKMVVVDIEKGIPIQQRINAIADKLKVQNIGNIKMLLVNKNREVDNTNWLKKLQQILEVEN